MSRQEIRLSGFGGQGIITAGYILGKGAALYDEKEVTLTKSYGPESRGGACSAQIMISDEEISYPLLIELDLLVVMSQEAYDKYVGTLPAGGMMLVESDLVDQDQPRDDIEVRSIPATRIAERDMGRKIVANIVMLGFVAANSDAVSSEAIRKSVLDSVPKGTEDLNTRAFEAGFAYSPEPEPVAT